VTNLKFLSSLDLPIKHKNVEQHNQKFMGMMQSQEVTKAKLEFQNIIPTFFE
jgi:hypothetical protein